MNFYVDGYKISIGKISQYEVDFVTQNSEGTEYYQVALTTRDKSVLERELLPLQKLNNSYPKYLITLDDDLPASYNGIKKINAIDFLLS